MLQKQALEEAKVIPLGLVQAKPAGVGASFQLMLERTSSYEVCGIRISYI
jgi:hypothetical protein